MQDFFILFNKKLKFHEVLVLIELINALAYPFLF